MKKRNERHRALIEIMSLSKSVYKDDPKNLSRRIEWILILSEEIYKEEKEREKKIFSLISSTLLASSFLFTAFVQFLFNKDLLNKSGATFFLGIAGSVLLLSIAIQVFILIYRRRIRQVSILDTAIDYLDEDTIFENDYSENYGRILALDTMNESYKRNNNLYMILESLACILLILFIICFIVLLFVWLL